MKAFFAIIPLFLQYYFCGNNRVPETAHATVQVSADTMGFKQNIQPILVTRCSPCHFTGGKMYEKLPFDAPSTIINHEKGILKRIKDENEKALIVKFIEENKPKPD